MPHTDKTVARYEGWFKTPPGCVAFEREKALLASLVSAWPRRGQTLLEVGCGPGLFLEHFWDQGFDVDGLDPSPAMLKAARNRMGKKADLHLGHAEHLPFDDKDYDFVVLITALEFCEDPGLALREAVRVARKGVLVGFLNRYSLYRLATVLPWRGCSRTSSLRQARWLTPREVARLFDDAAGRKPKVGASVLPGPPTTWREGWFWRQLNRPLYPACVGAFAAIRCDLVGDAPLTPLVSFSAEPTAQG